MTVSDIFEAIQIDMLRLIRERYKEYFSTQFFAYT